MMNSARPTTARAGPRLGALLAHAIEAKKRAYEDRARYYADPAFARSGGRHALEGLTPAARRVDRSRRAASRVEAGTPAWPGDTTYLAVADERGNMVSLIQSN